MATLSNLLLRKRKARPSAERPPTVKDPSTLETGGRYLAAVEQLQQGAYRRAGWMLHTLQAEYPQAPVLRSLLAEAQLKADLEATWAGKIIARGTQRLNKRLFFSLLVYLVVVAILIAGSIFLYQSLQTQSAQASRHQDLLAQAQAALAQDQDRIASALFRQVLSGDMSNEAAQKGYRETTWRLALASEYETGVRALQEQNFARARAYLASVQNKAPSYRNVERLLAQAQAALTAEQLLVTAETAYEAQQWAAAVEGYEALRRLDSTYATAVVSPRLAAAYVALGEAIVAQRPAQSTDLTRAADYFFKALRLTPDASTAAQAQARLAAYLSGERAWQQANAEQAVVAFERVYQVQPDYLGGTLVELLYAAYLAAGDNAVQRADLATALDFYHKAAALPVPDNSEALQRSQALSATPTATPTAPPIATPAPPVATRAPVAAPPPAPPPAPTATAAPAPATLADFKGWIAFRTNRDGGVAVYLMQPDGSQQQRAPDAAAATLDQLYAEQRWSPDGASLLYVANASGRSDANIFLVRADLPVTEERDHMLTNFGGDEYDPVWSPVGATIAFVSNHTGNDEIWVMNVPDGAPVQLTHNKWEWDKHPTWSVDGGQIAFFSNRSGLRQIWVMGADGANQHNISNSSSEDWDPVWIR